MHIVILDWTAENRIAKYQSFKTKPQAERHMAQFGDRYPKAFIAKEPKDDVANWLVDPVARTISHSPLPVSSKSPTESDVIIQALLDKGSITQSELDAARQKLS